MDDTSIEHKQKLWETLCFAFRFVDMLGICSSINASKDLELGDNLSTDTLGMIGLPQFLVYNVVAQKKLLNVRQIDQIGYESYKYCWKLAFGGEMRPPIFDELNTSVSHVGDLVSSHMHDLRSE
ncbi:hypothetical protein RND71_033608 [Anisodus tanguticus]|uniref:Uncharacterized protein n=1 Tax=Anisodus tanguticus TaxID=243964 RepID=A0AAE1R9N5_9SOLA|nr:hypothetical protein RND71_033608 [Anisodus tanguticus]